MYDPCGFSTTKAIARKPLSLCVAEPTRVMTFISIHICNALVKFVYIK